MIYCLLRLLTSSYFLLKFTSKSAFTSKRTQAISHQNTCMYWCLLLDTYQHKVWLSLRLHQWFLPLCLASTLALTCKTRTKKKKHRWMFEHLIEAAILVWQPSSDRQTVDDQWLNCWIRPSLVYMSLTLCVYLVVSVCLFLSVHLFLVSSCQHSFPVFILLSVNNRSTLKHYLLSLSGSSFASCVLTLRQTCWWKLLVTKRRKTLEV